MKQFILVSEKVWHRQLFNKLSERQGEFWTHISSKEDFNYNKLLDIKPDKIFIPHWSWIIPSEIYDNFECIVFHMTDLPYGRGGSPLQNLIVRGYDKTKISAIRVVKKIDAGGIYLKSNLFLHGKAEEIFLSSNSVVYMMIEEIIEKNLVPHPQSGNPTFFKRRKPEDGNISDLTSIESIFDFIRMLDAEGYPKAFFETDKFKFEFTRASLKSNKQIIADVRIIEK